MQSYTVCISWMVRSKWDYLPRSKLYKDVKASGIIEACNIALAKHKDCICPAVSRVWLNWPQK